VRRHRLRAVAGSARRWTIAVLLACAAVLWISAGAGSGLASAAVPTALLTAGPAASGSWTVYHGDPAGTGVAPSASAVDTTTARWTSPVLDGQLYGEPLVYAGRIYVATENDTVYALSAATGAVAWSTHLGRPVPAGSLPCGDISPDVGITGTPVIDPSRGEIFVVADEFTGGSPSHRLVGLSTASGRVEMSQDVDPPGAVPADLLQRTGLTLDAGQVVFGMGGNDGDCATYRGRVVAVPETGGAPTYFTVDAAAGENQGAVWMGGAAPVVDGSGDIWVSTGNGSVYSYQHAYDDSDAVLELSSSLRLLQYFAPTTWATNNSRDLDMSTAPVLLPDGQVVLAGKSRIVYLLDRAHLGGIGHQQATLGAAGSAIMGSACAEDIDGGAAVVGMTVYLPCMSGIIAVGATSSPPTLHLLWSSGTGGGPPIVAAGLVWTIGQNGVLYGLDPATGKVREQATIGTPANHFPTPSVGDGLLLAPSSDRVVAFAAAGPGATPTGAPTAGTSPASTASPHAATSHTAFPAALVFAAAAVVILVGFAVSRRSRGDR
jgi:outer membrane protein assembly factor BamB